MSRAATAALLVLISTALPARADAPRLPQLPIAIDISKVAVGAWAEYAVSGAKPGSTIRWAIVTRDRAGTTLEVSMADATVAKGRRGTLVQRVTIATTGPNRAAIQVAGADPLALSSKHAPPLGVIDAKHKAGVETITVKAGTFRTTKYRQVTSYGTLEYWVADNAPPLGIVKLAVTFPRGMRVVKKRASGTVVMELVKTGGDATAAIVKAPLSLDARNLSAVRARVARPAKPVRPVAPVRPIQPGGKR